LSVETLREEGSSMEVQNMEAQASERKFYTGKVYNVLLGILSSHKLSRLNPSFSLFLNLE
jgi:hypothetical protein